MSIEFGAIHNLVRTYQRMLRLPPERPQDRVQPGRGEGDRVSISPEARERQHTPDGYSRGQAPDAPGSAAASPAPVHPAPVQEEPR